MGRVRSWHRRQAEISPLPGARCPGCGRWWTHSAHSTSGRSAGACLCSTAWSHAGRNTASIMIANIRLLRSLMAYKDKIIRRKDKGRSPLRRQCPSSRLRPWIWHLSIGQDIHQFRVEPDVFLPDSFFGKKPQCRKIWVAVLFLFCCWKRSINSNLFNLNIRLCYLKDEPFRVKVLAWILTTFINAMREVK